MSANIILSLHAAVGEVLGAEKRDAVYSNLGLRHLPHPEEPVRERQVFQLFETIRGLPEEDATEILTKGGEIAAEVVAEYRIPASAKTMLRRLPWPLATWLMVRSAGQNAWTFGGSAVFDAPKTGVFELRQNPTIGSHNAHGPVCHFHRVLFETLFRLLVHPGMVCREIACEGCGGPACRFEVFVPPQPQS